MATGPSSTNARTGQRPAAPYQASYHRQTRKAHATEIAEDYVEAIADLSDSGASQGARVVDLARSLGVSHVTVIRTIARLARGGLVVTQPYKAVQLTPKGRRLADAVRKRHETVVQFLLAVGVDLDTARADAEGIEHHVSAKTLKAFEKFARGRGRKSDEA